MKQHLLSSIEGVGIFPSISLIIFVVVFAIIVYRTMKLSNKEVEEMGSLPLSEKNNAEQNGSQHIESPKEAINE